MIKSIRYQINDDRTYYFSGTASHAIRVTGGKPNIYRMQQDADWEAGAEHKYGIRHKMRT